MKKLMSFVKGILLCFMILFSSVANANKTGTCGDNLTWEYVTSTQTLFINGTGKMTDWGNDRGEIYPGAPWKSLELKAVNIASGVTSIGNFAFHEQDALTSVYIPSSVTSIGDGAFRLCKTLPSISLPAKLTNIGFRAFEQCYALTTPIVIPEEVDSVKFAAFYYCSSIPSVTLHDNITYIDDGAFTGCEKIESIKIPKSVTFFGDIAFAYCTKLKEIVFDWNIANEDYMGNPVILGVPEISYDMGSGHFDNISSDAIFYVPYGRMESYKLVEAFKSLNIQELPTISGKYGKNIKWHYDNSSKILTYSGTGEAYLDPSSYWHRDPDQYLVFSMPCETVIVSEGLTTTPDIPTITVSVSLPQTLTHISDNTFYNCKKLTTLDIPDNVYSIGNSAFCGSGVTTIELPDNLIELGTSVFMECRNLTTLNWPSKITKIPDGTFWNCVNLQSFEIPENITYIGKMAFYQCSKISSLHIPMNVNTIYSSSFEYMSSLSSITVDSKNTSFSAVDGILFNKDKSELMLYPIKHSGTEYTIPSFVTAIDTSAFSKTTLTSIIIPNSVSYIGGSAFYNCDKLKEITLPENITTIESYLFSNCNSLKSVIIPDGVTSIGGGAFSYCKSLSSLKFLHQLL